MARNWNAYEMVTGFKDLKASTDYDHRKYYEKNNAQRREKRRKAKELKLKLSKNEKK